MFNKCNVYLYLSRLSTASQKRLINIISISVQENIDVIYDI